MSGLKDWRVAVFADPAKRGGWRLRAYTLWFNPEWNGYVWSYDVVAATRREALKYAKECAREDLTWGRRWPVGATRTPVDDGGRGRASGPTETPEPKG